MTHAPSDPTDPKTLIADSYAIDGITPEDCRSIFLDWALSLPEGETVGAAAQRLLDRHGDAWPDHPMTGLLRDAATGLPSPQRRGGRGARHRPDGLS